MYTEDYERRGFPIRDFLLKLILVVIFAVILAWLLPKFIVPQLKTITNNNNSSNNCPSAKCDMSGLSALTSQIFADNIERMKNAALTYYTSERLPKEVGASHKMTLKEMIDNHLIITLIDKNNKAVDQEKSYVKITKLDKEYILKVNIKDSEKEDYILVHIGCYSYCETYLCQKQENKVPVKGSKTTEYVPIKQNTPSITYYCSIVGGKYYDANGNVVSKEVYEKSCTKPVEEKHYCVYYNNKYYGKNGNVVTEAVYKAECTKPVEEKHYCVIYNNKYYGKNGNVVTEAEYKKQCTRETLYEYQKITSAKLSEWTKWSSWEKTNCSTPEVNCSDNNLSCLNKRQILKRKEQIGTYDKSYSKTRDVLRQTGSYQKKSCTNYNYVVINSTTYVTTTTTTYTTINTITRTTQSSQGQWVYQGRASYSNPPRDTATTRYIFVGADYSYCGSTCTTLPHYFYDKYTYNGGMTSVSSTTTPGETTTTSTSETTATREQRERASCGAYVTKTIPIYSTVTITEKATRKEPLYGDVCYQSTKTRKVISQGKTEKKWSTYNDTSLLKNGWGYTGNTKLK